MSILFLDFDGVLNSTLFMQSVFKDDFLTRQPNETIESFDQKRLDRKSIPLLNQIWDATGCLIVVTSQWRNEPLRNRHYLHWLLVSLGFKGYIWGCTPHMPESNRSGEIREYLRHLKRSGCDTSKYAILDDSIIYDHKEHFVKTNPHEGLTDVEVAKVIDLLGPKETLT